MLGRSVGPLFYDHTSAKWNVDPSTELREGTLAPLRNMEVNALTPSLWSLTVGFKRLGLKTFTNNTIQYLPTFTKRN